MSKRIYIQEIGNPVDKLIFIEFVGPSHDLIIKAIVDAFKERGYDVVWGVNN